MVNGIARSLLEDVVNTVMVKQVEELEAGHITKRTTVIAIATNTEAKRQNQTLYAQALSISVRCMKRRSKRRSCVVGVFPSKQAMLRLIGGGII